MLIHLLIPSLMFLGVLSGLPARPCLPLPGPRDLGPLPPPWRDVPALPPFVDPDNPDYQIAIGGPYD